LQHKLLTALLHYQEVNTTDIQCSGAWDSVVVKALRY
jgi:hypothetical protein